MSTKTPRPCPNPWCRGQDDGGCGRTPAQHLEDGLTWNEYDKANRPEEHETRTT